MANINNLMAGRQLGCECGNTKEFVDAESGETVCPGCGIVMRERMDAGIPDAYNQEDRSKRSGPGSKASILMHDMGLSTVISQGNRDASGRPLGNSMKTAVGKLRMWDVRSRTGKPGTRGIKNGLMEINRLKDKMAVSGSTIERAAYIYRKAAENGLVKGKSATAIAAASMYAACRETGAAITLNDMVKASNIRRKDIARHYRYIVMEMDMNMPVVDASQCIARIASVAGIAEKTKRCAVDIIRHAQRHKVSAGKDPMALAAGALYIACLMNGENKMQREIAKSANVSDVTVRNQCRHIRGLADCAASCGSSA